MREQPNGDGAGVGVRLVGIIREILDSLGQIAEIGNVGFLMFRAVMARHLADVRSLVKVTAAEGNGESLDLRPRLCCTMPPRRGRRSKLSPFPSAAVTL